MAQSITRLSGVNSLSGTIPATNIANSTLDNITTLPSAVPIGKTILLSTATASSSSSIEFTSGIDSTYDIYQFEFNSIHPQTDNVQFEFQCSTDGGSNYNNTITSTFFRAFHNESGSSTSLAYRANRDLTQSTSFQPINEQNGNGNDENSSGSMYLFNPSSTTFVKHFISTTNSYYFDNYSMNYFVAGYFNTTTAINAIKFQMSSGNIDAGTIKMYGISA